MESRIHSVHVSTNGCENPDSPRRRARASSPAGRSTLAISHGDRSRFHASTSLPSPPPLASHKGASKGPNRSLTCHLDPNLRGDEDRRSHAPWAGQNGACGGGRAPGAIISDSKLCLHKEAIIQCEMEKGGKDADKAGRVAGLAKVVPVTSLREIQLAEDHRALLKHTGSVMLGSSLLLLVLLLAAWRGFNTSLITSLSPWLGVYLPVPLGILDGAWSLHCARTGYIRHEGTGSCISRAGLCGTAWGCSGPSCALNLGLDLGLLITALLATLPAAASANGCGYECYAVLCFPCAPTGGIAMAVGMVLSAFFIALGVGRKMWAMTSNMREKGFAGQDFLPW